jgi:hypothetical protein
MRFNFKKIIGYTGFGVGIPRRGCIWIFLFPSLGLSNAPVGSCNSWTSSFRGGNDRIKVASRIIRKVVVSLYK